MSGVASSSSSKPARDAPSNALAETNSSAFPAAYNSARRSRSRRASAIMSASAASAASAAFAAAIAATVASRRAASAAAMAGAAARDASTTIFERRVAAADAHRRESRTSRSASRRASASANVSLRGRLFFLSRRGLPHVRVAPRVFAVLEIRALRVPHGEVERLHHRVPRSLGPRLRLGRFRRRGRLGRRPVLFRVSLGVHLTPERHLRLSLAGSTFGGESLRLRRLLDALRLRAREKDSAAAARARARARARNARFDDR